LLPALFPFEKFMHINDWRLLQLRDHVLNSAFSVFHLTFRLFNR
jgi:hypothetical protein